MTATLAPQDAEPQTPASSDATAAPQQHHALNIQEPDRKLFTESEHKSRKSRRWNVWRKWTDGETSWWFASTGIPLLAAALGPFANLSSIAALVTSWRQNNYLDGEFVSDLFGVPYADPRWCYWLNVGSLICGFLGNIFLLFNFTQKIRYVVALPATIILWYISSGFLIAITACMEVYDPPSRPFEIYTQGYWYAVAAAVFYFVCSVLLMVNMLGYYLGHYPDHFALSDNQRTLILQTMFFFIWMAGGAAIYSRIQTDAGEAQWTFPNALYFCYVTILTVGFGDLVATTDLGRGLLFPYAVGGIITLALVVSSLYRAARELGEDHIVQKDLQRRREQTLALTATNSSDYRHRQQHQRVRRGKLGRLRISAPTEPRPYRTAVGGNVPRATGFPRGFAVERKPRVLLLKEEKDRFDAMRRIQADSKRFKRWMALFWSVTTFLILWCIGAIVFWQTEKNTLNMTYFQALYFCYISLLTIGYGDLSPKSNPGRCFFVIWSLISVPTMTILVSDLGDTVVLKFKKWSSFVADFTVLPKKNIWQPFVDHTPSWVQRRIQTHRINRRVRQGFSTANPDDGVDAEEGIEAEEEEVEADVSLSHKLALTIKRVAQDLSLSPPKRYSYDEWVEFTRLIRCSTPRHVQFRGGTAPLTDGAEGDEMENEVRGEGGVGEEEIADEMQEALIHWDWLGEQSPLVGGVGESEWVLRRLCESLVRVERGGVVCARGHGHGLDNDSDTRQARCPGPYLAKHEAVQPPG